MASELEQIAISKEDMKALAWSYQRLEHPSFAARLSNYIGTPIEKGLRLLPTDWYQSLDDVLNASIHHILSTAIDTLDRAPSRFNKPHVHSAMAVGAGAIGGFFGPLSLLVELPLTTTIILRAIAQIAREEGEDLSSKEACIACAQVFALGGRTDEDKAAEAGYYGIRTMLSLHFANSPVSLGGHKGPLIPSGVEFFRAVMARFGVVISDKAAAQFVPVAGAIGGAAINLIFTRHFQDIARGHFTIRRLERQYGVAQVRKAYQKISRQAQQQTSFSVLEGW